MDYTKFTKAELIEKLEEQRHLAEAVEAKDKEIITLKEEFEEFKLLHQGSLKKSEVEVLTNKLEADRRTATELAQHYIKMHHDLLKQTQQNLEMALFTEQVVSDKFKKEVKK